MASDCEKGEVCVEISGDFTCVPDASGTNGQNLDPCEYINACDPGLTCISTSYVPPCDDDASGCCTEFCDLSMPICSEAGLGCLPYYTDGGAPDGLENVGICAVEP